MKAIIILAIIAYAAADSKHYDLEKIDMNKLVDNNDAFKSFVDCLLDREECTKQYAPFRAVTLEAVEQNCKRCTSYQKHSFWLFLQGLMGKYLSDYNNFRQKYDPERKYFENLETELRKYSIDYFSN